MKNVFLTMGLLLLAMVQISAQTPVIVCEQTIKIGGMAEEDLFFGFAAGDQINFEFESDKELKEIQIFELIEKNSSQKYSNFKAASAKTTIFVPEKAVYQFHFKNGAVGGRICKVKIQRVPESEATQRFNTTPRIKTLYDTTYTHYTEDSLVGYKTVFYQETKKELTKQEFVNRKIYNDTPIIHSKTSSEGQYSRFPIEMPRNVNTTYRTENVIDCYCILGLGEDAIKKLASAASDVTSALAVIPGPQQAATATAAATAKAVSAITSTTDDDIKYSIRKLVNGQKILIKPEIGFSSAAEYHFPPDYLQGTYEIQFYNDNIFDALKIKFLCYAVVEVKEYEDVVYDRERQEAQYVPVNRTKMNVTTTRVYVPAE